MSLDFQPLTNNSKLIATMYKDGEYKNIYVNDLDDLPEGAEKLTRIRLNTPDSYFFPAITDIKTDQTDRYYIVGSSGCGKSRFAKNYIKNWLKMYPKGKVLLFSSKMKDEQLDKIKGLIRVEINENMLEERMTLDEIKSYSDPVLTVFDDVQDFPTKKLNNEIARLRDEILRNGRSYHIFCLYIYHDPTDYIRTKSQIMESNKVVAFPRRAGVGVYDYLFTKYLKLSKHNQTILNKLKSDFAVISKNYPQYIITDKFIMLV